MLLSRIQLPYEGIRNKMGTSRTVQVLSLPYRIFQGVYFENCQVKTGHSLKRKYNFYIRLKTLRQCENCLFWEKSTMFSELISCLQQLHTQILHHEALT